MWDIAAGLVLVAGLSLICLSIGILIERRCSTAVANGAGLSVVVVILLYAILLHGRLLLARILPVSNVIVLSNMIPLGAGALTGIVLGRRSIPWWRRTAVGMIVTALAWYTVLCDLVGPCPAVNSPRYHQGLCMQTSRASCSPCCAASLLTEHGIPASEQEMIGLCLTREHGTPALGLYRGLKLKTRGTRWDVEVFRCSLEEMLEANRWPVILVVRLLKPSGHESMRPLRLRWPSRADHAVVVYGITDSAKALIGDPAQGKTRQSLKMLERVWYGEGLRLVDRGRPPATTAR